MQNNNNIYSTLNSLSHELKKEIFNLKVVTEKDYDEDQNPNELFKNQSIKLLSACKEFITTIKYLIRVETTDQRKVNLENCTTNLAKELTSLVKNFQLVLDNPYDHSSAQAAKINEGRVLTILIQTDNGIISWKQNPPIETGKVEQVPQTNLMQSNRNSQQTENTEQYNKTKTLNPNRRSRDFDKIWPKPENPNRRSREIPKRTESPSSSNEGLPTLNPNKDEIMSKSMEIISLMKDLITQVKERNGEGFEITNKQISANISRMVIKCNSLGWKDVSQTLISIHEELTSSSKMAISNPEDSRTLHETMKSFLININLFMKRYRPTLGITPKNNRPSRESQLTSIKEEAPESESSKVKSLPEKIFDQFKSQFLSNRSFNSEEKEKFVKKLSEMLSNLPKTEQTSQESPNELDEDVVPRNSSIFFGNKNEAEEELTRMEKNFSNIINDMTDWHSKMKSPFKFWRPTTIANGLEIRSQDYVKFIQRLLDCNDTIR